MHYDSIRMLHSTRKLTHCRAAAEPGWEIEDIEGLGLSLCRQANKSRGFSP
jgi:hypothetical protein